MTNPASAGGLPKASQARPLSQMPSFQAFRSTPALQLTTRALGVLFVITQPNFGFLPEAEGGGPRIPSDRDGAYGNEQSSAAVTFKTEPGS
jgi:hypothetical protein